MNKERVIQKKLHLFPKNVCKNKPFSWPIFAAKYERSTAVIFGQGRQVQPLDSRHDISPHVIVRPFIHLRLRQSSSLWSLVYLLKLSSQVN